MHGSQLLAHWRASDGLTCYEAGDLARISGTYLLSLEAGRQTPSIAIAARIERATRGLVPIESWIADADARRDVREMLIERARRLARIERARKRGRIPAQTDDGASAPSAEKPAAMVANG